MASPIMCMNYLLSLEGIHDPILVREKKNECNNFVAFLFSEREIKQERYICLGHTCMIVEQQRVERQTDQIRGHSFLPGCENDSPPLLSSDGLRAERVSATAHLRPSMSICLLTLRPTLRLPTPLRWPSTIAAQRPFSLVLCIVLRKCSTPRLASSRGRRGREAGLR